MTYKKWLEEWLEIYVRPSSKEKTYIQYSNLARLHLIPRLGDYQMEELTPLIVQRFITKKMESGNLKTGKGLSTNTVNGMITVIQNSLGLAYTLGIIPQYEMDKLKRPKPQSRPVECFSKEEQKKIEQAVIKDKREKMKGIILCLYTGIRLGELLALEWSDINFSKAELTISKTCHDSKDQQGNYCRVTNAPKTLTSERIIPIPVQLLPMLREVKKRSSSPYVVANGEEPISIRSYQRSFELLLKKLKIPHHGFHALRHTFATRAIENGMDVKSLSEILGHKSSSITLNRYVHSLMSHKRSMMNRLGKMF